MKRKLWALALLSALLKLQLHFYDWTKGDRALEMQGYNATEIKLSTMFHPPVWISGNVYPSSTQRTPAPLAMGIDETHFSLVTVAV